MSAALEARVAVRTLIQRPAFSAIVTATIAAAIAFNVASASVLGALLRHPFPYPDLDRLVLVRDARTTEGVHQGHPVSPADVDDIARSAAAFERVSMWRGTPLVVANAGSEPVSLEAAAVSADFFTTLGVTPDAGEMWPPDADRPGRDAFIVLTRRLWRGRLGGDPSIVGRTVLVNGRSVVVAAIVADEDAYPAGVDAWVPLALGPAERSDRGRQTVGAVARLAAGTTQAAARAQLAALAARLAADFPETNRGRGFDLLELRREQYEFSAPLFGLVQAAAILVLLLGVVNVTTLVVGRTIDRQPELAVRFALGASRRDVVRAASMEAAVLTVAGGIAGLSGGAPVLSAIRASLPEGIARWVNGWQSMHVDAAAIGAGALLAAAAAVAIAAASSGSAIAIGAAQASGARVTRRRWTRRIVVGAEVSLAATLLLCGAVTARGLQRFAAAFDRFAPQQIVRFELNVPVWRYADDRRLAEFHRSVVRALSELNGVARVALVRNEPASNVPNPVAPFERLDARVASPGERPRAGVQVVSPGAFDLLRLDLVAGRPLAAADSASSGRVGVISREAMRRFWPDRNPVGTSIALDGDSRPVRIVGVVSDVLLNWYDAPLSPVIYLSDDQQPARSISVLVRTEHEPLAIAPRIRSAMTALDPQLPIRSLEPLEATIADSLSPVRIVARLLTAGALLAAALAAIGIFGVLAQFVAQRRREFGVRFALGATSASIARLVVADALGIAAAGTAAGLSLAVPALGLLGQFLLGLPSLDAAVVGAVALCGIAIALAAAYVPARRAARVDVAGLLRLQ